MQREREEEQERAASHEAQFAIDGSEFLGIDRMSPAKKTRAERQRRPSTDAKMARIIPLLAIGTPHSQIAQATRLTVRTIERYASLPETKKAIDEAGASAQISAEKLLTSVQGVAVATLLELMTDEGAKPEARVKAALGVLDRTKLGPSRSLTHSAPGGGAIQIETVVHQGVPVTKSDVRDRALELAAKLTAELEAENKNAIEVPALAAETVTDAGDDEGGEDDSEDDDADE